MDSIIFWLFVIGLFMIARLRKVPPNTTIIIDRNSHFHKKKRSGYYWFNPKTDKITTMISTHDITEQYTNVFKTHDDRYWEVPFSLTYHAVNMDMVLSSLQDSRRSIYDVVNCAIETVMATYSLTDFSNKMIKQETFYKQLESMLEPFYIDVTSFRLGQIRTVSESYGIEHLFNKHVSSGDNPVGASSYDGLFSGSNDDDPFKPL